MKEMNAAIDIRKIQVTHVIRLQFLMWYIIWNVCERQWEPGCGILSWGLERTCKLFAMVDKPAIPVDFIQNFEAFLKKKIISQILF